MVFAIYIQKYFKVNTYSIPYKTQWKKVASIQEENKAKIFVKEQRKNKNLAVKMVEEYD